MIVATYRIYEALYGQCCLMQLKIKKDPYKASATIDVPTFGSSDNLQHMDKGEDVNQ